MKKFLGIASVFVIVFMIALEFNNNKINKLKALEEEINGITDVSEYDVGYEIEKLDTMFNEDMAKETTNVGINNVFVKYGDLWRDEMYKYVNKINDELATKEKKEMFKKYQQDWEAYSDEESEFLIQMYDQVNGDGSIMAMHSASIYYNKYRDRTLELRSYYETLTEHE